MSEELIAYAERLEANPPRVARMELASGLRRLAQRCIRGVRRASCRGMADTVVPQHRSSTAHTAHTGILDTTPSAGECAGTSMPTGSAGTYNRFVFQLFTINQILCLTQFDFTSSYTCSFR